MRKKNMNDFNLKWTYLFKGQIQHVLIISLLLPGVYYLAVPGLQGGFWLGISSSRWLGLMTAAVIIHQAVVALVFRTQLVYSLMSRIFGKMDLFVWGIMFLPFLFLRLFLLAGLAFSSAGTVDIPLFITVPFSIILAAPALYTLWSVIKYFGLARALGGDHFRQKYRELPFVRNGAFRFSSNAMYSFVFLFLWSVALAARSGPALAGALFQHACIWVHWYCTEAPDMDVIYGK